MESVARSESRPAVEPLATLALAGIALTFLDALLTYSWVALGIAIEANPIILALIRSMGHEAALLIRAFAGSTLLAVLWTLRHSSRLVETGLRIIVAVLAVVVTTHVGFGVLAIIEF